VGGIVIFIWGFISHAVLPLGEAGIKSLPNEEAILTAMRENIKEHSVYLFPGFGESNNLTPEQQEELKKKWEQGPTGFLVYNPQGTGAMSPKQLVTELLTNIIAALIAAFLLSQAAGTLTGMGSRVLFVALIGLVPFFSVEASYWNWYGFPMSFALAALVDQVVGFALAGAVMAKMLK
jgi:hypothetical protein